MTCALFIFLNFCAPNDAPLLLINAPRDAQVYVRSSNEIEAERKWIQRMKLEGKG